MKAYSLNSNPVLEPFLTVFAFDSAIRTSLYYLTEQAGSAGVAEVRKIGRFRSHSAGWWCTIALVKKQSKRQFVGWLLNLAVAGFGGALAALTGCRRNAETARSAEGAVARRQGSGGSGYLPPYVALHESGELARRGKELWERMSSCDLCPRECGADRLSGQKGLCNASAKLVISSHHPHFGEERPLVGRKGSGTIFLTHCSLRCVFCINWEVSQGGHGWTRSLDQLAGMMIDLQKRGCHNINVVTPTHYSAHILLALDKAAARGLRVPFLYNTCGWERLEILKYLDGVVDIYLPDFKYFDSRMAAVYSPESDTYPELTKLALLEMHRQVGVAKPAEDGLMYRGLMIRHLVMPNNVGGSREVMEWIAENLPKDTYVNIMSQYRPVFRASEFPAIARRINREEYREAVSAARQSGLVNLDVQGEPFAPLW
jgi:putative pyruvate formate lyase activating enzyme